MATASSDPRTLRALAHPVRWKLIDLLEGEGTATVTRCAEALGESTATCSYHLGILAKYGYIARAPAGPGRDKPWRLASRDLNLSAGQDPDADAALASREAAAAFLDHALAWLRESVGAPPGQRQPRSKIAGAVTWLTDGEAQQAAAEVGAILDRYAGRGDDPSRRPPGARQARILAAVAFAPERPAAAG